MSVQNEALQMATPIFSLDHSIVGEYQTIKHFIRPKNNGNPIVMCNQFKATSQNLTFEKLQGIPIIGIFKKKQF